jgi:hypothetical protein
MKKCAYCDRENEDDAVRCRDCGTIEFTPIVVLPVESELEFHPLLTGAVRSVSSLDPQKARELVERLRFEDIPGALRTVANEGGLEIADIVVEEVNYSRACKVVETWISEEIEKSQMQSGTRCRKCGCEKGSVNEIIIYY